MKSSGNPIRLDSTRTRTITTTGSGSGSGSGLDSGSRSHELTNGFNLTTEELTDLHDPKSILKLKEIGGIERIKHEFNTDFENGLDKDLPDKVVRQKIYGENRLPSRPPKSFFKLAWEALQDKVLIMLSIAAIVSLALGLYETFGQPVEYDDEGNPQPKVEWVEGVAIIVAILIVVVVGAVNDYQKEKQFTKLNSKKDDRDIIVYRSGVKEVISIYDLVVGDILGLETGDIVPADCILVSGSCECDESALTGETNTIKKLSADLALRLYEENFSNDEDIGFKNVPDPMLISGSKLLSGVGKAVVTAIGPNSIHGRTLISLKVEPEETPLQARLTALADGIAKFGLLAAALLFIVLFIRFLCLLPKGHSYYDLAPTEKGTKFLNIVITAITIVVVAVPEGLPLAVTLALAFATTRMMKDGNLVRVLRSCETMGGATAVCSDKTGTLTLNRMRVVKGLFGNLEFDDTVNSKLESSIDIIDDHQLGGNLKKLIVENISLNSSAFPNKQLEEVDIEADDILNPPVRAHWYSLKKTKKQVSPQLSEPFVGSKTETALLIMLQDSFQTFESQSLDDLRDGYKSKIVQLIPFESSRKWGGIVLKVENGYRFYVKGASEIVFSRCDSRMSDDGSQVLKLNQSSQTFVNSKIEEFAKDALRTILMAHKDFIGLKSWPPQELIDDNPEEADPDKLFGQPIEIDNHLKINDGSSDSALKIEGSSAGLVMDSLVGIQDPLRPGVPGAVEQCQRAGVVVRMVTGDNITTAKAISFACNILQEEDLDNPKACMEGPVFRKLSQTERDNIVPQLKVLARSSPEDKRILVKTLRDMGEVVAVTGDGTNDAPALKLADVGFSMGISGTEVAREASDIILMTDDFKSIVDAIKWGRTVAASIKKFIQFQLTVNVTAVVLTFVSAVASSSGSSVLTAVQLLWVNLIMDTLAALALATDKPDDSMLNRTPAGRSQPLISVAMWKMIMGQSMVQLVITFVLHFAGAQIFFGTKDINDHQSTQLSAMTFNAFVWLQFFALFVSRKLDEGDGLETVKQRLNRDNLDFSQHVFRNWYFVGIAAIIGGFQILIMFVGGAAFSIARQTGAMWGTAIICGLVSFPAGWIIRIIPDKWVVRVFPTRLYRILVYLGTFRFLRNQRRPKNPYPEDDLELSPLYEAIPPFRKAKEEIIQLKSENSPTHNPIKMYHDWRVSRSNSNYSSNASTLTNNDGQQSTLSAISALAMVPTAVGGAVAGWHRPSKELGGANNSDEV
ncbi:hypothetical protein PACTADRAFT_51950 [Pachysolen tannophilus NRRL Y-2460]|uniref:Calcium-transporting ATPase n=1 Tax=Pachysolen tannophilus NRRL Y-2460 TaxID=669874 RepID=A0A1E4TNL3_PACTA|nr:hypothetical protein PACTADRAFT_51950 [Pachysolen tannophilus NRRL Y-2460]